MAALLTRLARGAGRLIVAALDAASGINGYPPWPPAPPDEPPPADVLAGLHWTPEQWYDTPAWARPAAVDAVRGDRP